MSKPFSFQLFPAVKYKPGGAYLQFTALMDAGMFTSLIVNFASQLCIWLDPHGRAPIHPHRYPGAAFEGRLDLPDKDARTNFVQSFFHIVKVLEEFVEFRNSDPGAQLVNTLAFGELEHIVYEGLIHYYNWRVQCGREDVDFFRDRAHSEERRYLRDLCNSVAEWPKQFGFQPTVSPIMQLEV